MEFKDQSIIRQTPIENPARLNVLVEKVDADKLKLAAIRLNTTYSEIIRTLVHKFVAKQEIDNNTNKYYKPACTSHEAD